MKTFTVEQQIDNLRPLAKNGLAQTFHNWLVASAALLVILSVFLWNPIPLMIAIFLGVVGIAERSAGPNIAATIKAYDTIKATSGEVTITISCWDTDNHYHARYKRMGNQLGSTNLFPKAGNRLRAVMLHASGVQTTADLQL